MMGENYVPTFMVVGNWTWMLDSYCEEQSSRQFDHLLLSQCRVG
jgi:hypothetical protein